MSGLNLIGAAVMALTLAAAAGTAPAKVRDQPNIIVVLVDDMGYSDLGAYGGEVRTPNIDRLARNGLRFTQLYNSARCCPSQVHPSMRKPGR